MYWLALALFGWGTTFLAIDIALDSAPVMVIATARPLLGAAMILIPFFIRGRRIPQDIIGVTLLIGFLNTTLTTVAAVVGTASVGPGLSAVLVNSSPFFIALLAARFLREPVTREIKIGIGLGFVGILAISFQTAIDELSQASHVWGLVTLVVGALGFATAGVIVRRIARDHPDVDLLLLTGSQLLFGGLLILPFAIAQSPLTDWASVSMWSAFLYLGLTAAGMWGWFRALESLGAARAASFVFLAPIITLVIEFMRGKYPSLPQGIGIALVLAAIWLVTRTSDEPRSLAPQAGVSE